MYVFSSSLYNMHNLITYHFILSYTQPASSSKKKVSIKTSKKMHYMTEQKSTYHHKQLMSMNSSMLNLTMKKMKKKLVTQKYGRHYNRGYPRLNKLLRTIVTRKALPSVSADVDMPRVLLGSGIAYLTSTYPISTFSYLTLYCK